MHKRVVTRKRNIYWIKTNALKHMTLSIFVTSLSRNTFGRLWEIEMYWLNVICPDTAPVIRSKNNHNFRFCFSQFVPIKKCPQISGIYWESNILLRWMLNPKYSFNPIKKYKVHLFCIFTQRKCNYFSGTFTTLILFCCCCCFIVR